jgi:tetratricopeptide (TPR) repeat protein
MIKFRALSQYAAIVAFCFVTVQAQSATGQNAPASEAMREANALFQAQKWAEAAKAYEAITKAEPNNGAAHSQLGSALLLMGNYSEAAQALRRAVEITASPVAMYNLACSYARLNDRDKSFDWLNKSVKAGFTSASQLTNDPDLASLREDARFKEVMELIDRTNRPCMYSEKARQFDFWVGEWVVTNPQGQQVGINNVKMLEDGCIIEENWAGALGGTGKSINFFDSTTGKWRQTWVSNGGGISEFAGQYSDGALRFEGESHLSNGQRVMRKLTFFNLGPDRVRQFSEASSDDGKNWTVNYDFTYTRKK